MMRRKENLGGGVNGEENKRWINSLSLSLSSKQSLKGVQMVNAVRNFLESFRLPGEAPIVERILESFSKHWLVGVAFSKTFGV
jgi:hypothetical protein